jgi:hypothetical protein
VRPSIKDASSANVQSSAQELGRGVRQFVRASDFANVIAKRCQHTAPPLGGLHSKRPILCGHRPTRKSSLLAMWSTTGPSSASYITVKTLIYFSFLGGPDAFHHQRENLYGNRTTMTDRRRV